MTVPFWYSLLDCWPRAQARAVSAARNESVCDSSKRAAVVTSPCIRHPNLSSCGPESPVWQHPPPEDPCSSQGFDGLSLLPTHPQLSSGTGERSLPLTILRSFNTIQASVTAVYSHSSLSEPYVASTASPGLAAVASTTLTNTNSSPLPLPYSRSLADHDYRPSTNSAQTLQSIHHVLEPSQHVSWCTDAGILQAAPPPAASRSNPQYDRPSQRRNSTTTTTTISRNSYVRRVANSVKPVASPSRSDHNKNLPSTPAAPVPFASTTSAAPFSQTAVSSILSSPPSRVRHSFQALLGMVSSPLLPSSRLHSSHSKSISGGHDNQTTTLSTCTSAQLVHTRRPAAVRRRSTFSDLIARDAIYALRTAEQAAANQARIKSIEVLDDALFVINGVKGGVRRSRSFEGPPLNGMPNRISIAVPLVVEPEIMISPYMAKTRSHSNSGDHNLSHHAPSALITPVMATHLEPTCVTSGGVREDFDTHADVGIGKPEGSWATVRSPPLTKSPSRNSINECNTASHNSHSGGNSCTPVANRLYTRSSLPTNLHSASGWSQQQRQLHPLEPHVSRPAARSLLTFPSDHRVYENDEDCGAREEEEVVDRPSVFGEMDGGWGRWGQGHARTSNARTSNPRTSSSGRGGLPSSSRSSAHQLHQMLTMGVSSGGMLSGLGLSPRGGGAAGGGTSGRRAGYERRSNSSSLPLPGSSSLRTQMILDASSCMLHFQQAADNGNRHRMHRSDTAM